MRWSAGAWSCSSASAPRRGAPGRWCP